MKDISISIITPVYNGEKYLESYCEKLSNQTFRKFELLMVNDCSKDNSLKLMEKLAEKYTFITILNNPENKGAGYSRNIAIKQSKYDYVICLDCDDDFPNDYLEVMIDTLINKDADMAVCDVKIHYEFSKKENYDFYSSLGNGTDYLKKEEILSLDIGAGAWNKLLKKELLIKNPFSEGIINEDVPAILGSVIDASKIAYTDKTCYTYIQNEKSVQNGSKISKKFDVFKAVDELFDRKKGNKILEKNKDNIIYNQIILFYLYSIIPVKSFTIRAKSFKRFMHEIKKRNININQNEKYWYFIDTQGKKINTYYRVIYKLISCKLNYTASLFVSCANLYKKINKKMKHVDIYKDLTLDHLIKSCKKNQKNQSYGLSVIIPNYNYSNFMYQRIYSILEQKVKIDELIILDDCSKDDSVDKINEIVDVLKKYMDVTFVVNEKNSGSPFKQWDKGFNMAKYNYVWIAEADDLSNPNFLNVVMKPLQNDKKIVLSYCDTKYININGDTLQDSVEDLVDIMKTSHWSSDYINDGEDEIRNYEFLNCTIANVSSVIFKKDNYKEELKRAGEFRQCGDWYFYYCVLRRGKIAFSHKNYNYCRIHGSNSTTNLKKTIHYNEIKEMHSIIQKDYNVRKDAKKHIDERLAYLRQVWDIKER